MDLPAELYYTKSHEWVRDDQDGKITVGITAHAQESLGDIVYVELPEVDDEFEQDAEFGSVESVKAVGDLYMPLEGTIVAINDALEEEPKKVNTDPYTDGWLVQVELKNADDLKSLLTAEQYKEFLESEA